MLSHATDATTDTTYHGIIHNKNPGSLVLTSISLNFHPASEQQSSSANNRIVVTWDQIAKHQVSPASHPKSLLRVVLLNSGVGGGGGGESASSSLAFAFPNREILEHVRRDVSNRLSSHRHAGGSNSNGDGDIAEAGKSRKRPHSSIEEEELLTLSPPSQSTPPSTQYIDLDPTAQIAARSSILASDPALRAQHRLLVLDTGTLTEADFWNTHSRLVANEYAKISGWARCGLSSDIKSSLEYNNNASAFGYSKPSTKSKDASSGGSGKDGSTGSSSSRTVRGGGVIHLGVEEMRQIFIMYPAVHRAYEEKVPLELSEEQFWRKYLESEYFHRDRGRLGSHMGSLVQAETDERRKKLRNSNNKGKSSSGVNKDDNEEVGIISKGGDGSKSKDDEKKRKEDLAGKEEEAKNRLAAAGTDDIFSRYENNRQGGGRPPTTLDMPVDMTQQHQKQKHKQPQRLAIGKFDLTATVEVERGSRFLGNDLHPNPKHDTSNSRIVDKYNRHWAIVLHPIKSMAGVNLKNVTSSRSSSTTSAKYVGMKQLDDDAKVNGGNDSEMRRLVGFANANECDADFARGVDDNDDDNNNGQQELHLRNVDAYAGKFGPTDKSTAGKKGGIGDMNLHLQYAKILASTMRASTESILRENMSSSMAGRGFCTAPTLTRPFPEPKIGRGLLEALTKKMSADSKTEADVQELANTLPEEFKTQLATFFRRASELLRHFFSLRSVFGEDDDENGRIGQSESQKQRLANIVKGMEKVCNSLLLWYFLSYESKSRY